MDYEKRGGDISMKIKKTSHEIKDRILDELKNGPLTIAEISGKIKSNWLTTEKFVNELSKAGLVLEIFSSPKMKVYRRTDDLAYYGLPFSEDIRNKSASLLFTVADKWQSETKTIPSKTIIQKIAVELIEKSDKQFKDIPILRFHYGQTLAVRYDETFKEDYQILSLSEGQNSLLLSLIEKYKKMSSSRAQIEQYKKEGMEFYYEKETNVIKGFSEIDFKKIENNLLKLSIYYPIELENTFELFDKFIYCSIALLNLSNDKEKQECLNKIKEIFYLLWDTITTNYFFYDSEKYILPEKKELFNQIKSNILNSKISNLTSVIEDLESEVNAINPEKISKSSSEKSQEFLHELLGD